MFDIPPFWKELMKSIDMDNIDFVNPQPSPIMVLANDHNHKVELAIRTAAGIPEGTIIIDDYKDRLKCYVMPNKNEVFTFDGKPIIELTPMNIREEIKKGSHQLVMEQEMRTFPRECVAEGLDNKVWLLDADDEKE